MSNGRRNPPVDFGVTLGTQSEDRVVSVLPAGIRDALLSEQAQESSDPAPAPAPAPRDRRARISVSPRLLTGPVLAPLRLTGGLMFPYTPTVIFTRNANYDDYHLTHSNYRYYQFRASAPGEIQVTADFTAQTHSEARYMLAAIRFFKSMTLSEFGEKAGANRGAPPPVLRFNYLGDQIFRNVPVVISLVNFNYEPDVDYVPVPDLNTHVPMRMLITANLAVQPNPEATIREFSVEGFKSGDLIKRGYI